MTGGRRRVLRGYTDLTPIHPGRLWTIYRAFDIESSKWIAIRVIRAGAVQPYLLDELEAEITAASAIEEHPNIAKVSRFSRREEGTVTLAMELCRESYRDRLRREGPLSTADVVQAAYQVTAALDVAARSGVAHRDVGPSKILLSRSGRVVLGGFGLAQLKLATREPASPVNVHTAPEIFEGAPVSAAADVYSLCSTMFELLAGRPPFEGFDGEAPASLLLRIVGEPAPPLRVPGVPLALAEVIASGLSKDPAQRPSTASELAGALPVMSTEVPHDIAPAPSADPTVRGVSHGPVPAQAPPPVHSPRRSQPASSGRHVLDPITAGRGAPPAVPLKPPDSGSRPPGPR